MRMPEFPALPPAPRRWPWRVLLLLGVVVQCLLFGWQQEQHRLYATTGLRFSESLTEQEIQQALNYAESGEDTTGIFASFWGQQLGTVTAQSARQAQNVYCIGYCGTASDCLPVSYQTGAAPGTLGRECAVSSALAEALFGSFDVTGLSIFWQEEQYTISGVFAAKDCVLLAPSQEALSCAELRGVPTDTPKAAIESWCRSAGLPPPQAVVYGPQRTWLADCLVRAPLLLAALFMLITVFHLSLSWPRAVRWFVWFVLAFLLALHLPVFLNALPGWIIPARWSDFSFWQTLAEQIRQSQQAWAGSTHFWRDYAHLS